MYSKSTFIIGNAYQSFRLLVISQLVHFIMMTSSSSNSNMGSTALN